VPDLRSSAANRALAAELRLLRERALMSGDEVASALRWSASKVSRIETSRIGIKRDDLTRLLDLYAVDDTRRSQLIALASGPDSRGWWSAFLDSISPDYATYISLEDGASAIRCWSPEIIHGLLQTEAYAQAVMDIQAEATRPKPREIQRRIEVRIRRQDLLTVPEGKSLTFILDESALLHRFGTADVMRQQLAALEQVSHHPNVTVRVLPFAGAHPITPGGFTILEFAPIYGIQPGKVVYFEQLRRSSLIDDEDEVFEYQEGFERLSQAALDEEESRRLISAVGTERWS
jgi:transcriptional regulator with XRE-family HTH domain